MNLVECSEWIVKVWNLRVPVGTVVELREDSGNIVTTTTRSEAWQLAGGAPVVKVAGKGGGYLLTRITPSKLFQMLAER